MEHKAENIESTSFLFDFLFIATSCPRRIVRSLKKKGVILNHLGFYIWVPFSEPFLESGQLQIDANIFCRIECVLLYHPRCNISALKKSKLK